MAQIMIEVTDQELKCIYTYAELKGLKIEEAVKLIVFERLESEGFISDDGIEDRGRSLDELFEGFEGEYTTEEIDWGEPVGDEVW